MNSTVKLLRLLGSPYSASSLYSVGLDDQLELLRYAAKNRLSLLYLDAINQREASDSLASLCAKEIAKYIETSNALIRISHLLTDAHIKHAVIKTVRPYLFTTVDIDVLIFGNAVDYERAIKTVRDAQYLQLASGPMSVTFQDPKMKIGIDLYREVAVSCVPYIDKAKLIGNILDAKLPNGGIIKTLTPEADLLTIIAHSIIKENMYTMSEYYTHINYLERLNVNRFIELVKQTHLRSSTRIHTTISAMLHKAAHKTVPKKLIQILNQLGRDELETAILQKKGFEMPHKYHPITIIRCLLEILEEDKTRKGIAMQMFHALDPRFSQDFLKKLISHIVRETY